MLKFSAIKKFDMINSALFSRLFSYHALPVSNERISAEMQMQRTKTQHNQKQPLKHIPGDIRRKYTEQKHTNVLVVKTQPLWQKKNKWLHKFLHIVDINNFEGLFL